MSIKSKYSDEELRSISKETYMREASFEDILSLDYQRFEVAVLIRESTSSQEQLKAFEIQKDSLVKLVEDTPQFHLKKSNIFEEKGTSGLRADDRPAFQMMCRKAAKHEFDILIVDAVSRLARNVRELFDVVDDFSKLGIGIMTMKERYWTFNMVPTDILRLSIDAGFSQAESMNTGVRVKTHMLELAKKGQLLGGDMFGYRLKKGVDAMGNPVPENNRLVQKREEAEIVKQIFDRYTSDNPREVMASGFLCKYLIEQNMQTFNHDLNWTPSKIIRVLSNTKYMGYQLPQKSKIVDTVKKKKVSTHVEPKRDIIDRDGNIIEKGNLVRIKCDAIVSEEIWWKAYDRRMGRSSKNSENIKGRKSGLRVSSDAFGRKVFCSCGYCLSRQYTHVATEKKGATYRYKCRWQIIYANKYTKEAAEKEGRVICNNEAVSEMKIWLCSKYVFKYLFKNGKAAVIQALELIETCKREEDSFGDGIILRDLEDERNKLKKRLKNLQKMYADELIDIEDFKEQKAESDNRLDEIDRLIAKHELDQAKKSQVSYDMDAIRERLDTFIDLKRDKVSDEMIDMFVERIIYRGNINGNDEFLWVMNLSGEITDTSAKYKINRYDKAYSDSLKDDRNFNIVARMIIPLEDCKEYCEEIHRVYKAKYWRPITIKIAVL